jgi:transposase
VSLHKRRHGDAHRHFDAGDPGLRSQRDELAVIELLEQGRRDRYRLAEAQQRQLQQQQLCTHLHAGMNRSDATATVGISRSTFYRWLGGDPQFAAAVADAELAGIPSRLHRHAQRRTPTKLHARARTALLDRLRAGGSRSDAAAAAGVSRQTFYTWLKQFPDLNTAVQAAEQAAALDG